MLSKIIAEVEALLVLEALEKLATGGWLASVTKSPCRYLPTLWVNRAY